MYIEEIIIDGFKSYAKPTRLSGFDPHFNAITGLNGSGKSNILDAICFVLGISNLSQVRAASLQELVYKQGQAGVERAVVTLVFNNMDKRGSPIGKEDRDRIEVTREVGIGSKNKYRVDGRVCQQNEVQNLFHSVQLNVNNPHFLIMQGRITKVLNMKPAEILGMIEEAAGTRMFETKKQSAIKTIDKKQAKVDEINNILAKEITPTLERLRAEKVHYIKWSTNNTEVQRLERFCEAHAFCEAERKVTEQAEEARNAAAKEKELNMRISELRNALKAKDVDVKELEGRKDGKSGRALKSALAAEEECSKELVKASSAWENKKAALQQDVNALTALKESEAEAAAMLASKKQDQTRAGEAAAAAEAAATEAEAAQTTLQGEYQGACAGVGGGDQEDTSTLEEQEAAAEAAAGAADAAVQQAAMRAKHLEAKVATLEKEARATENEGDSLRAEQEAAEAAAAKFEREVAALGYDAAGEAALRKELDVAEAAAAALAETTEKLQAQLSGRLRFDYSDPERGFDRSRVKGLVAQLVYVKDAATATALEVTAGGKLYQVVVDTEQTGKLLLQKGRLRRRITIIPLSSISRHHIDQRKLKRAADLASARGGTAQCAIELVGFEHEVEAAVEHVFGSSIVCDSLDTAKQVAFHKDVRTRCVTLDGDVFEPGGTLTGGSRAQLGAVLAKLRELTDASEELGRRRAEATAAAARLEGTAAAGKRYAELSRRAELKRHEASVVAAKRQRGTHSQLETQLGDARRELAEAQAAGKAAKAAGKEAREKRARLRAEAASFRDRREKVLRKLEVRAAEAKKAAAVAAEAARASQQRLQVVMREVRQLEGDVVALAEQVAKAEAGIKAAGKEVYASEKAADDRKKEFEDAQTEAAARREEAAALDAELNALLKAKRQLSDELDGASTELKAHRQRSAGAVNGAAVAERRLKELMRKHQWIADDKGFFGKPGTDYDFAARDPKEAAQRLEALKAEQHVLSRKINKKVVGMIESMEADYKELMRKREVIENDKAKIRSVIAELDRKKDEALQTTWVRVNRDFGSIFSTLLPGTSAKLEPPEGANALEGLEVKVAFGSVWKESLTELSGGQRSLLALSLILALLLFKPAPMYILDEVDAALDLSHTQNIGAMLRTHFAASQFIVVSLKEGMFNNANVIFRTRFVEGVSAVSRTVNAAAAAHAAATAASGGGRARLGNGGGGGGSSAARSDGGNKAKRSRRAVGEENEEVAVA